MIGEGIAAAEQLLYAAILWAAVLGGVGVLGLLGAGFGIRRAWRRRSRHRRASSRMPRPAPPVRAVRPLTPPGPRYSNRVTKEPHKAA